MKLKERPRMKESYKVVLANRLLQEKHLLTERKTLIPEGRKRGKPRGGGWQ